MDINESLAFLLGEYAGKGQLYDLYKKGEMEPEHTMMYKGIMWAYDFI